MRAAGQMGHQQVTMRNLTVVEIDPENNLMLVQGAVPGVPGSYVMIRKAKSGHGAKSTHKK
jgi:large subunit ribosomal protein L3